ncbi:MAG: Transcriptional regulator, TetR family protein [Acidimicrobiales bacterium]|nr:Transcriptional regulator, TetR family protein [Acidimicrobiales bacterium]
MSTRIPGHPPDGAARRVRTPMQARSRATVEAILGGTARVLASRGYAKATTNHIADAAGVSIGSFYQYFADKDAAIAAFAEQYARETLAFAWDHVDAGRAKGSGGGSPASAWLMAMLSRASENEALVRALFQEVPYTWSLPAFREAMDGALDVVARVGGDAAVDDDQLRDRAYVILKAAVAVIIDVVLDTNLRARRESIVSELARMIDAYLAEARRAR